MKLGIRDEIQHVQSEMLQDLLESRMKASFGEELWLDAVFAIITFRARDKNNRFKNTYNKIADKIEEDNSGVITVRDFDVTLTSALLLFDLFQICSVGDDEIRLINNEHKAPADCFLMRVGAVRQSKNDLISHNPNPTDKLYLNLESWTTISKLKELLKFLQNAKWVKYNIKELGAGDCSYERVREICEAISDGKLKAIHIKSDEEFLEKYSYRIDKLIEEFDGSPCRLVRIAVQHEGRAVEGFRINVYNTNYPEVIEVFSGEILSEPVSLFLPLGSYFVRPQNKDTDRYKLEDTIPFEVSFHSEEDNLIVLEAGMNDDKRFEEAFDLLNSKDDPESALVDLRQLANRENIYAALVLAYIYYFELLGTQDPDRAQHEMYLHIAENKLDSEKWEQKAAGLREEKKLYRAAAMYMGHGLKEKVAISLRFAANICFETKIQEKNYNIDVIKSLYSTAARWGDFQSREYLKKYSPILK